MYLLTVVALLFSLPICFVECKKSSTRLRRKWNRRGFEENRKPNIVFILADDLDIVLGSPEVMKKTRKLLREGGVEFTNAFVTTPICCPSRSSILTGRYVHNHHIYSNNRNCSSQFWKSGAEKNNFGKLVQGGGYLTGYFGKYLNEYDGSYIPPGWDEWDGLLKNSRFYNYTLNRNGKFEYHKFDYHKDYFTHVVTDHATRFFRRAKVKNRNKPVMMVIAMAAPHGPEDPAPEYYASFQGIKAPRPPNYNYTSLDKHWIIRASRPLDETRANFIDLLHRRRLLTLLSLDDAIERLVKSLRRINELDNTYIFFSSDHGYHLGQFNIVKGKAQPYETDIRIPMYVRGPGIEANTRIKEVALNIDLAPTFLDIAGVPQPDYMDGASLLDVLEPDFKQKNRNNSAGWRDTFLVERGKMFVLNRKSKSQSKSKTPNRKNKPTKKVWDGRGKPIRVVKKSSRRTLKICSRPNYPKLPCTAEKKKVCIRFNGQFILVDCRSKSQSTDKQRKVKTCDCKNRAMEKDKITVMTPKIPEVKQDQVMSPPLSAVMLVKKLQQKKRKKSREYYRLLLAREASIDNLRRLFKTELSRIKRKLRKRYLRHLPRSVGRPYPRKFSVYRDPVQKNGTVVLRVKLSKIDRKIAGARQRLVSLREKRRKLKFLKPTSEPQPTTGTTLVNRKDNCDCKDQVIRVPNYESVSRVKKNSKNVISRKGKNRKSLLRKGIFVKNMNCFYHTAKHWKTPPLWTDKPFSSCNNAPNNTFWCLRTVNNTHNFLYCYFVTSFHEYFDLNKDPYQLKNIYHTLKPDTVRELNRQLSILRSCKGTRSCTVTAGRSPGNNQNRQQRLQHSR